MKVMSEQQAGDFATLAVLCHKEILRAITEQRPTEGLERLAQMCEAAQEGIVLTREDGNIILEMAVRAVGTLGVDTTDRSQKKLEQFQYIYQKVCDALRTFKAEEAGS